MGCHCLLHLHEGNIKTTESKAGLADEEEEMSCFWWYHLNHYIQPSPDSSSTIEIFIAQSFPRWVCFLQGKSSCRLLQQMHRETLSVPQNRAAHLVFGDDACGPVRRSLVTWSSYSFRSSHLLLLLFLKPANDLVTVFLCLHHYSLNSSFSLHNLHSNFPRKRIWLAIWYSPLNIWSAFLQVVPFGMFSCARVPPHLFLADAYASFKSQGKPFPLQKLSETLELG